MPTYAYFFLAVIALLIGYFTYGRLVEKIFGADDKYTTPACCMQDGVDYVKMSPARLYLIQLLNIAGLGPIFGPILGALYGPAALLWVVLGCIFAGAVHDYCAGMLSVRYDGKSVPEIIGANLGKIMYNFAKVFVVLMLLLLGVVFTTGPAGLLHNLSGINLYFWLGIIFFYYILATLMPIDKIIGRIYPFFGVLLAFMAVGLVIALFFSDYNILNTSFLGEFKGNPNDLPVWPMVFITIACGAISGFHCTQSTLTARCLAKEKDGRFLFYGAMVGEGIIALIWVTLGMSVYPTPEALNAALGPTGNSAFIVQDVSVKLLGAVGGTLAILGVVILPITSGDTAFRSARLMIADALKLDQKPKHNRFYIAVPMFTIALILNFVDFSVLWRYFGWANQTVAMLMLWTVAVYLIKGSRCHWIATIPAAFMTAVTVSYICFEQKIGLGFSYDVANMAGIIAAVICTVLLLRFKHNLNTDKKELFKFEAILK